MSESKGWAVRPRRRLVVPEGRAYMSDSVDPGVGFVAACVRMMDTAPEKSRVGSDRVHISSLVSGDWCPRAHLLARKFGGSFSKSVNSQQRIVWELGRAAERHVRRQFIEAHGAHRVIGNWSCMCGAVRNAGPGGGKQVCQKCGTAAAFYGELVMDGNQWNVTGAIDLTYEATDSALDVVEIKSIKKEDFEALSKPSGDHTNQCGMYVRLLAEAYPQRKVRGRVIYVAKDYVRPGTSPYREFMVADSITTTASPILSSLLAQARSLPQHEAEGTLPERLPACPSPTSPRAKRCDLCAGCFAHS